MLNEHQKLVEQIKALYARLHVNALSPEDIIYAENVAFPDYGAFIPRIYNSPAEFDVNFANFKIPYDIFRAFPANKIILDVGAHWGYSVVAMRHQGCKARIFSIEAMQYNSAALNALKILENGHYDWFNVAAGAEEGELKFYIPVLNGFPATGLSSTGATLDDYFAEHLAGMAVTYPPQTQEPASSNIRSTPSHVIKLIVNKVHSTRIDTLLRVHGDLQNDVVAVKMDVEGHESFALKGAEKLFTEQKPMIMMEEANRNERVTAVMMGYGYFHCERHDGKMVPHLAYSLANDGFWVHPDRVEEYRRLGIFEGKLPTKAEMDAPPVSDGVVRKGPAGQF